MEIKVRCKNGLTGTALASAAMLESTSDNTHLMVLYDISSRKQIEQKLKVSEARLTRAEITAKSGHWELNIHSLEIVASAGAERIYGVNANGLTLEAIKRIPLDEYRPAMDTALHALIERDAIYDIEFQIRAVDSGVIKDVHSTAFFDREHGIVFGVIQDITEYKIVQARLQMAASVFTHAREGITIADSMGAIVDVNDTFTHITGYSREEAIGKNPRVLKSGRHPPEFYESMWDAILREGFWSGEIWNMRKSGEIYPELLTISAVKGDSGQVLNYIALFSDIAHIKRYQAQLEQLAQFDRLTGLPNRALLDDRLNQAMLACQRRESTLAVVYIDLDGFKVINDSYGHDVGDQFLTRISLHMKEALREGDTMARVGGDEFVAILVDLIGVDDCIQVLERLLQSACYPVQVANGILQVSASIGVSFYPQVDADANTLIKQADQAMYLAKKSGKNRFQLFRSY
jgi:diguanylate cyclase (GGDEF)-like protein/PAS domain S-box-containing protein